MKMFEQWRDGLPSTIQIGEKVKFIPMQTHCDKFKISKEICYGKVVSVKFTESKVFYDILDDYRGIIFDVVDSANVKKEDCDFTDEEKNSIIDRDSDGQYISC